MTVINSPTRSMLPIPRANRDSITLPAAEASLLATDLVAIANSFPVTGYATYSTHQPAFFLVHAAFAVSGILRVKRTLLIPTTPVMVEDLNQGVPLVAQGLYTFQVPLRAGDAINFRYSATNAAQTCANGTGTATGSPITLVAGLNTITVTGAGTFTITLPAGITGVAASGTATLVGGPVTLPAGAATAVDTGATTGTFTITLTGHIKIFRVEEIGAWS